jgi:voltage-gated potassium channel
MAQPPSQTPGRAQNWVASQVTKKGLRPRHAAYAIVAFWIVAVVIFGVIERIADPHTFPTVWLAFWWAIQTVTTVGYGDVVPNQTSGKVMAGFLMLGGLSMLTILTASITSAFIAFRQEHIRAQGQDPVAGQLEEISRRLETIEGELRSLRATTSGDDRPPGEPTPAVPPH